MFSVLRRTRINPQRSSLSELHCGFPPNEWDAEWSWILTQNFRTESACNPVSKSVVWTHPKTRVKIWSSFGSSFCRNIENSYEFTNFKHHYKHTLSLYILESPFNCPSIITYWFEFCWNVVIQRQLSWMDIPCRLLYLLHMAITMLIMLLSQYSLCE